MTPTERLFKLFEWGDKNDIVIGVRRFRQYSSKTKLTIRYYEINFLEVNKGNAIHRSSVGKAETLDESLKLIWEDYKR